MSAADGQTFQSIGTYETAEAVAVEYAVRAMDPVEIQVPDRESVILVPDGQGSQRVLDLEAYRTEPARIKAARVATDPATFLRYINRYCPLDEHETPRDQLEVWADSQASTFSAQLDAHQPGKALSLETHTISLTLKHTPEWLAWMGKETNGKYLKQTDFALFIESRVPDFIEPEAAVMLEIAQHFKADIKTAVKSTQRLADGGIQMAYVEEIDAKSGKTGDLTIPEEFVIAIRPYVDGARYKVTVRLRYQLVQGELKLGYSVANPEKILEAAFNDVKEILMLGVIAKDPVPEGAPEGYEPPSHVVVPGLGVPIWNGARH